MVNCQQKESKPAKKVEFSLALNVLNMVNDTYRFDLEGKKASSCLSHIVTGELINGYTNSDMRSFLWDASTDKVNGKGLGLYQKWSLYKKRTGEIPYICYGLTFRDVQITFDDEGYIAFVENSLEYYRYGKYRNTINVKTALYNFMAGVQFKSKPGFIFDTFLGIGYKDSSNDDKYIGEKTYRKRQSSFAYNGWITQAGFKLGFRFY